MKTWQLAEDKLSPRLPVIISPEIDKEISTIESKNIDNEYAITQWRDCLSVIINQISKPSIAWDNVGIYQHESNGETHANIFGHDISFTIETDRMGKNYVDIFYFDLKPEDYGLREEIQRRKVSLLISESQLRFIIRESLKKILNI